MIEWTLMTLSDTIMPNVAFHVFVALHWLMNLGTAICQLSFTFKFYGYSSVVTSSAGASGVARGLEF